MLGMLAVHVASRYRTWLREVCLLSMSNPRKSHAAFDAVVRVSVSSHDSRRHLRWGQSYSH